MDESTPPPVYLTKSGKKSRLCPRECLHCKATYMPIRRQQKYCRDCGPNEAIRKRLRRYGTAVLPTGLPRTACCKKCEQEFTYTYIGGKARELCDLHTDVNHKRGRRKAIRKRATCAQCGLSVEVVAVDGLCFRHSAHAKADVTCWTCGRLFGTSLTRPHRFCSPDCRASRPDQVGDTRSCALCLHEFTREFPAQKYCTDCAQTKADAARIRLYGVSRRDVEAMRAKYDDLCWICKDRAGECVDHCHSSGLARGWLCNACNRTLHYVEREGWLSSALEYLQPPAA